MEDLAAEADDAAEGGGEAACDDVAEDGQEEQRPPEVPPAPPCPLDVSLVDASDDEVEVVADAMEPALEEGEALGGGEDLALDEYAAVPA